jgi:hypothetical protein
MKRMLITLVVGCLIVAAAGAQKMMTGPGFEQELQAAIQELGAGPVGTLTVADFAKLAERISIAQQKIEYVQKSALASMIVPGAGQFMNGDPLGGSLYLTADLAVAVGALVGAYFALPSNVQFGSLDYLNTPLGTMKTEWEKNTVMQYLPAMGVVAGGMLLKMIVGHFAAAGAAQEARDTIAQGKVTFKPTFGPMGNGMGMGMEMRF